MLNNAWQALILQYHSLQIHRIPVVDNSAKLVGIVTRTDIFTALENEQGSVNVKVQL